MTQSTDDLLAQRKTTHGEYSEHARCTQAIMEALQRERGWSELPDIVRESLHMFAHKMGRVVTGNWAVADHYADIAGYATLIVQRLDDGKGLREGHRPCDLPDRYGPGAPLNEHCYEMRSSPMTRKELEELVARVGQNTHHDKDVEPSAAPPEESGEHLIHRSLNPEDVGKHVQLRDGRRAAITEWIERDRPYAFKLREVLLTGTDRLEEILPPVNLWGEVENGSWNPTDVHGVWEPKPTREEQLYGKESGRANIGHPGELSCRFLCDDDIGKTVFRRDGTTGILIGQNSKHGYTVKRTDGACYFVNKNGFMHSMEAPNAADIRQVVK